MELESQEAAVPVVVHLGAQVGEDRRRRGQKRVEDLDDAALFRNEDPPIAGESHGRRLSQPGEDDGLLKARRKGRGAFHDRPEGCDQESRREDFVAQLHLLSNDLPTRGSIESTRDANPHRCRILSKT
jgi:hypothetical protein